MRLGPGISRRRSCWEPSGREAGTLLLNPAMDDFTTRTYGTSGLDNRPLFGETSARVGGDSNTDLLVLLKVKVCWVKSNCWNEITCTKANRTWKTEDFWLILQLSSWQDRIINLAVGGFTSVVVLVSTDFFYGLHLWVLDLVIQNIQLKWCCLAFAKHSAPHPLIGCFLPLKEKSSTWARVTKISWRAALGCVTLSND